jgi:pyruvate dehydrogenase E1 component alpha subunit
MDRARAGGGPSFIEAMTRRWAGSMPLWPELVTGVTDIRMAIDRDPPAGPHETWYRDDDPVLRLVREILSAEPARADEIRALDARVLEEMAAASARAVSAAVPDPSSLTDHVFATGALQ